MLRLRALSQDPVEEAAVGTCPNRRVTQGSEPNHCSKFVVVIGSKRCRTKRNGSNPERCICLTDIVESKIFKTSQNSPLFS